VFSKQYLGGGLLGCLLLFTLGGCVATSFTSKQQELEPLTNVASLLQEVVGQDDYSSETLVLVRDGVKALGEKNYEAASADFGQALKLDTANSGLHFLNGLTYHLRALNGDSSLIELAEQGYQLAIKFDSSNWIARYHLGLLALDQKKYSAAQGPFAEVLLFNKRDPDLLYSMVVASYYAQDPRTASGVLEKLRELEPDSERVLAASCMIKSALGDHLGALASLKQYVKLADAPAEPKYLKARIDDWQKFYEHSGRREGAVGPARPFPAFYQNEGGDFDPPRENVGDVDQVDKGASDAGKMIIVDVVIIRTEENITTRKGVNLLNGLAIQFGSSSGPAYAHSKTSEINSLTSNTITRALNVPAINYSLNIFNNHSDRAEILARPTLIALDGEQSRFFSGLDISAATVGSSTSGTGSSVTVNKKVGVGLEITPVFQDNNSVKLQVHVNRTFLRSPSVDIIFENKIETSETEVTANVIMNYGETLVLSGLSEKETERIRDGVPFLQSVPGLQYFFSRKNTRDFQRSVLVLLTPRPPQYVYRENGLGRNGSGKEQKLSAVDELQARYSDWFKPYPNWASVFHHLQSNSLYREFRTGDVAMEKWRSQQSLLERLKEALGFLYY
jgi:hypothetical protein